MIQMAMPGPSAVMSSRLTSMMTAPINTPMKPETTAELRASAQPRAAVVSCSGVLVDENTALNMVPMGTPAIHSAPSVKVTITIAEGASKKR